MRTKFNYTKSDHNKNLACMIRERRHKQIEKEEKIIPAVTFLCVSVKADIVKDIRECPRNSHLEVRESRVSQFDATY